MVAEKSTKNAMGNKPTKFVSLAIIFDPQSEQVLLQHRTRDSRISPDKWGLFGGHGNANENPMQTVIRELKEEMGVSFSDKDLVFLHDYTITPDLHRYVFLVTNFSTESQLNINDEAQGFEWVPLEKVFEYDLTDRVKIDFEKFLQSRSK